MRIEFNAGIEDFLALHQELYKRRQDQVKLATPAWIWAWLLLAFAAAGAYAAGKVAGMSPDSLLGGSLHGMAAGCIGGAALLVPVALAGKLLRGSNRRYMRALRAMMESGALPIDTGVHVAEIEDDDFVFSDPVRSFRQPLSSFEALEEHEDCMYLVRRGNPEFRIPLRAFESEAQLSEFKRRVEPHLQPRD